jgi:DNA-binding transcriptional LysR family regulator
VRPRAGIAVITYKAIDPLPVADAFIHDRSGYPEPWRGICDQRTVLVLPALPDLARRGGLLALAGRSGLSPTRKTIIVMSSIRSPAVNSNKVRRIAVGIQKEDVALIQGQLVRAGLGIGIKPKRQAASSW